MKCQHCEDRIQQLLDDRVDPRNDMQIRQHAETCSTCRLMLGFYACLDQPAVSQNRKTAVRQMPSLALPDFNNRRNQQSPLLTGLKSPRHQQMVLSVAIVMLVLIGAALFVPINPNRATTARDQSRPDFNAPGNPVTETLIRKPAGSGNYLLADWMPSRFPTMSDVSFNSWSNVDLAALVPREPVDSVRGFPVAFESVAPYCRYSSEIPVVNQWANGISYTLNLLRARFPISSPSVPIPDDGFGAFHNHIWSQTC